MNKRVLKAILYKPLRREYILICNLFGFFNRSSSSCSNTMVKSLQIVLFLIQVFSHTFCLLKMNSLTGLHNANE